MRKTSITLIALLAIALIPAAFAVAGKGKSSTLKQKGKVGISSDVEPGDSFVPKSGGSPIKLKFQQKGKRLTKVKTVDFDEIYYLCDDGPDVIAKDVRIVDEKVTKAKKNKPASFRFFGQGADLAFGTVGLGSAKSFKFEFSGEILDGNKRATGRLRSDFDDREYGKCSTGTQVWRSEQ